MHKMDRQRRRRHQPAVEAGPGDGPLLGQERGLFGTGAELYCGG